jgi:cytochrome c oxidase subunit 2
VPEGDMTIGGDVMPLLADAEGTTTEEVRPYYGFGSPDQDHVKPADLVINVTGIQFAWLFNYPDDNITAGELHVPVGKDVQLNLSAQDVIHSFWVPQFRLKQDAIPGLKTELRFVATKPGTYPVVCTELCGAYHGGMRSQVIVHPQEEFEQWVAENRVVAGQPAANSAVAANPAEMTPTEFLAPVSQAMGVPTDALAHLHAAPES